MGPRTQFRHVPFGLQRSMTVSRRRPLFWYAIGGAHSRGDMASKSRAGRLYNSLSWRSLMTNSLSWTTRERMILETDEGTRMQPQPRGIIESLDGFAWGESLLDHM